MTEPLTSYDVAMSSADTCFRAAASILADIESSESPTMDLLAADTFASLGQGWALFAQARKQS